MAPHLLVTKLYAVFEYSEYKSTAKLAPVILKITGIHFNKGSKNSASAIL